MSSKAFHWLTITFIIQAIIPFVFSQAIYLKNVACAPYIDHVATDPGLYRYEPFYVKMHRCHGKDPVPNPKNMKCVPESEGGTTNVSVFVFDQFSDLKTLEVVNHTACVQKCVISQESCSPFEQFRPALCDCKCNYSPNNGPSNCFEPFVWSHSACNCKCPLSADKVVCKQRMVFSKEECGCTCKSKFYARCAKRKQIVDEETCHCIPPSELVGKSRSGCDGGVNGGMLAVVILAEAFLIVFCYYFFYVYCYKHNYLRRKADKQNVSAGYYHNGDIPNDTVNGVNGAAGGRKPHSSYGGAVKTDDNGASALSDKELIRKEERDRRRRNEPRQRHNGYAAPPLQHDKERLYREDDDDDDVELVQHPGYYPDEEKASLDPSRPHHNHHNDHRRPSDDMYYDIMQVDGGGPPSSLDNHNLNIPPDYSDAVSEFSEDGYGSVTQV